MWISRNFWNALFPLIYFGLQGCLSDSGQHVHMRKLLKDLLGNYSTKVIPQIEANVPINVTFDVALNQLIDVDERHESITTIIWVRQYWKDPYLVWDPKNYGGIDSFVTSSTDIWLPDITLYNNANDNYDKSKEKYYGITVRYNGSVAWFYPTIYKSSCKINVQYFPFDDQTCQLKFGSWSYHGLSLDLFHKGEGDTKSFIDNGEWILIGMPVERKVVRYKCCPEPYPFLAYSIRIRRRTMYYFLNFITPCLLMSALTVLGFLVPVESGERMNVGITVLLSLTVILLLLAEELPATSEVVPLISQYYTTTMINVFLSIVFTCIVLTFHHHAPTPVPPWINLVVSNICAHMLGMNRGKSHCRGGRNVRNKNVQPNLEDEDSEESVSEISVRNTINEETYTSIFVKEKRNASGVPLRPGATIKSIKIKGMETLVNQTLQEQQNEELREDWKYASRVLNRLFTWIVLGIVVVNTISMIFSAPGENLTA